MEPEVYARRDGDAYVGLFRITNLEDESIHFNRVQVSFLYDDPEKAGIPGKPQKIAWSLKPRVSVEHSFTLPVKDVPRDAFGFGVHYHGITDSNLLVRADVYFEVRTPGRVVPLDDPEVVSALNDIASRGILRDPSIISLDWLQNALTAPKDCDNPWARMDNPRTQPDEIMGRIMGSITLMGGETDVPPEVISEGVRCTAEMEGNPPEGYVCQLTDEVEWVCIPARIINARKGDVILSPGGNGAIGGLLRQLNPPQVYSHSGIMVTNHYRIRHSTGSEDWLIDASGTEGIEPPEKLKYVWPGTVEQTVEEAFNGSEMVSPEGRRYRIRAFSNETRWVGTMTVVDPLVVKPDPLVEAEIPQVREQLHRVAESAKEINGHYRFYCYTDAGIFFDDYYRAPDRGSEWWASNTYPTVCSSMIWAAIKRLGEPKLHLEGAGDFTRPSDLEPSDIEAGAEVDSRTRDGLYYYREEERRNAGNWLYNYLYNMAYKEAGPLGTLFTDAPDDIANQMCNTFAFDWSGEDESGEHAKDSDRWKDPGPGHAVSPDDILKWDAPSLVRGELYGLYGYFERLIYRPARLERRRVSRLVRISRDATLRGTVLYRGSPVGGAVVTVAGRETVTGDDGTFGLTVPAGTYRVEAGKLVDGWYMSAHQDVNLTAGEEESITLILEEPDEMFREVTVRGEMFIVDDESWPWDDETARRTVFMTGIRVGPFDTHAERSQIERMGGEVRVELYLEFDWRPDSSIDISYEARLYEGTTEDTTDLEDTVTGTINVPRDRTERLTIGLVNRGFGGGDTADITLSITNDRQP